MQTLRFIVLRRKRYMNTMRSLISGMAILKLAFGLVTLCALNLIAVDIVLAAGPPGPPGGGGDPPCWPPPCIPIDGGIGLLLAAGLAYGGKKAHDIVVNKSR